MSQKPFIRLAYYRGRWVFVPLFHIPEGAINDDGSLSRFRVIPLDGQKINSTPTRSPQRAIELIQPTVTETILPWKWVDFEKGRKELKTLCKQNGLELNWVTNWFPPRVSRKRDGDGIALRRVNRKNRPLISREYRRVRQELYKLNKQVAVIADILWVFNKSVGKGGSYVSLEELLRLRIEGVAPEHSQEGNWIRLERRGFNQMRLLIHYLPTYLWKDLCKQIHEKSIFAFSNRNGGPLLAVQIERYLKKAAKNVGLAQVVTSLSLRPVFNKKRAECWATKNRKDLSIKANLEAVTPKEWKTICRAIPSILKRRGRKSSHSPRELFNAMLHHEKTGCPFRKLPNGLSVHSQYLRWKDNLIFEKILAFRKVKNSMNSATK